MNLFCDLFLIMFVHAISSVSHAAPSSDNTTAAENINNAPQSVKSTRDGSFSSQHVSSATIISVRFF